MSRIFVSHSSLDRSIAVQICEDLRQLGHDPWLDEWEIKVGDPISQKVERGIAEADYVAVVLTPAAVSSNWVDREWRAKYWEEVETNAIRVLPLMVQTCEIPALLRDKKYADFRRSYSVGLVELSASILPSLSKGGEDLVAAHPAPADIADLLSSAQNTNLPLSMAMAEAIRVASNGGYDELIGFCERELLGWATSVDLGEANVPLYRVVDAYMSPLTVNLSYAGWNGNVSNLWEYMAQHPDEFSPRKFFIHQAVSMIEARLPQALPSSMVTTKYKATDLWPDEAPEDLSVYVYARGTAYKHVYDAIRVEFTRHLMSLLPTMDSKEAES